MNKDALENVRGKLKQVENSIGNSKVKAISIYWLYLSAFMWKQLPMELFEDIQVSPPAYLPDK